MDRKYGRRWAANSPPCALLLIRHRGVARPAGALGFTASVLSGNRECGVQRDISCVHCLAALRMGGRAGLYHLSRISESVPAGFRAGCPGGLLLPSGRSAATSHQGSCYRIQSPFGICIWPPSPSTSRSYCPCSSIRLWRPTPVRCSRRVFAER